MKLGQAMAYRQGDGRVTALYEEYVNNRPSMEEERDALATILTRPVRVRTDSFSASSAGMCLRRRQFEFLGRKKKKPDTKTMNIFANGDYVHMRVQVAGLTGGWLKEAEVSVEVPRLKLKGTMDGLLAWDSILEVKSINSNGFSGISTYGPKREHVYQTHAYMFASGLDSAHIFYENKNTQQTKEFFVEKDEETYQSVESEFTALKDATEDETLLPMLPDCIEQKGNEYRWCPFKETCPLAKFASQGRESHTQRTFSIRRG